MARNSLSCADVPLSNYSLTCLELLTSVQLDSIFGGFGFYFFLNYNYW